MPLVLTTDYEAKVPIEVAGILPATLQGKSRAEIGGLAVRRGRRQHRLDEFFSIDGSLEDDQTLTWKGNLGSVDRIGQDLASGKIVIESHAGQRVGQEQTGGQLVALGHVGDYAGVAMTGGQLTIWGNAGDHVGSRHPGEAGGMNRGSIWIKGDAGAALGQAMRRGTIVVEGNVGELCGWNLLAGTIVVFGGLGPRLGVGMKRGTIVWAGAEGLPAADSAPDLARDVFSPGPLQRFPILPMLARSLSESIFESECLARLAGTFRLHHGDALRGGRGEVFVRAGEGDRGGA